MFKTRRGLALVLLVQMFMSSVWLAGGVVRVQAQSQNTERQRRSTEAQQPQQPKPTPTPPRQPKPADDDVTVQGDEVVRVETDLTNILFSAIDKQRRFVTTLRQEDVRVLEDGQPQEVFTFARQTDLPLSLAILIDTSISEERTLPAEKSAASDFINAVIRPNKDEAAIVSFTGEATLEQGLTGSIASIRRAIDRVEFVPPAGYIGNGQVVTGGTGTGTGTPPISNSTTQGSTAIWDAVWITSDEVLSQTSDKTRRAIILLTDGVDTSSNKKMAQAIERAIKADAVIYTIGIGDLYYGGIEEGTLRKVAEQTGGRAFFPSDESDLRAAFAQIQEELRSQYLIAYSSSNKTRDGAYRRVQVEIVNPELRKQNMRLTYREGYFAKTAEDAR
ncbi:MAG TPA: VWA domain-containing protein [Pyrinomonadaceae bacterium]|jgi:VWFA-related protein